MSAVVLCRTLITPSAIKTPYNIPINREFICDYYPLSKIIESRKHTLKLEYGVFHHIDGFYKIHCRHDINVTFNMRDEKKEFHDLDKISHITLSYSIKENDKDVKEIEKYKDQRILINQHADTINLLRSKRDKIMQQLEQTDGSDENKNTRIGLNTEIDAINLKIYEHIEKIKTIENTEHVIKYSETLLESTVDLRINEICRMKIYNTKKMAYDIFDFYWYIDKNDNEYVNDYNINNGKVKITTIEREITEKTKKLKRKLTEDDSSD